MVFTRKDGIFMGYVSFREGTFLLLGFLVKGGMTIPTTMSLDTEIRMVSHLLLCLSFGAPQKLRDYFGRNLFSMLIQKTGRWYKTCTNVLRDVWMLKSLPKYEETELMLSQTLVFLCYNLSH